MPFFHVRARPSSKCNKRGNRLRGEQVWEGMPRGSIFPKADSPGRLRIAALEAGFSSDGNSFHVRKFSRDSSRRLTPQTPMPMGPASKVG